MELKPFIPAYLQIKDDIIMKIRSGIWPENESIPSEQQLMSDYKVGRGTIRTAVKLVIDEGYLQIKKGIGTFVTQKDVGVSIEPFVSLTYFIKMRGLEITTEILDRKSLIIDDELSEVTGLKKGEQCLYIKRLRILDDKPIGIETFYFTELAMNYLGDYDFTKGISHYLFEENKIEVAKMNVDFEVLVAPKSVADQLKLEKNGRMIKSCRTVKIHPNYQTLYYMEFYCGEKLSQLGKDGFI